MSKGFKIERAAYALDGKKFDLKSLNGGASEVKQNDRFAIVVKVTSEEAGGRVLLVDRLPAGFEIENPRLVSSGTIAGLDWLKSTADPNTPSFATTASSPRSTSRPRAAKTRAATPKAEAKPTPARTRW